MRKTKQLWWPAAAEHSRCLRHMTQVETGTDGSCRFMERALHCVEKKAQWFFFFLFVNSNGQKHSLWQASMFFALIIPQSKTGRACNSLIRQGGMKEISPSYGEKKRRSFELLGRHLHLNLSALEKTEAYSRAVINLERYLDQCRVCVASGPTKSLKGPWLWCLKRCRKSQLKNNVLLPWHRSQIKTNKRQWKESWKKKISVEEQKVSGAKGQQRESQFHCFEKRRKKRSFPSSNWVFTLTWSELEIGIFSALLCFDFGGRSWCKRVRWGEGMLKGCEWVRPISVCYVLLAAVLGRLFIYRGTNHPEGLDALLEPSLENLQPRHTRIINQVWFIMMAFFFCSVLFCFFFWQSVPAN